MKMRTRRK